MPSLCATPGKGYSSLQWGAGAQHPQGIPTPLLPQGAALVVRIDACDAAQPHTQLPMLTGTDWSLI